jgi:hypothetical protein
MKKLSTPFILIIFLTLTALSNVYGKEFYELRVYELTMGSLPSLEKYFAGALIPSLNKHGVKNIGVFREMSKDEPPLVYLLIPYQSMTDYEKVKEALAKDQDFQKLSEEYNKVGVEKPLYFRYESSFMHAFDGLPKMIVPEKQPRIFELRIYQGYSEDAVRRKVKMFNEGEFDIFYETKLNPVFFGEVVAGKDLPCLAYMITFKDMEERDKNWKAFIDHPEWKKMSGDPQYKNTVSKIIRIFLEPMSCSQI